MKVLRQTVPPGRVAMPGNTGSLFTAPLTGLQAKDGSSGAPRSVSCCADGDFCDPTCMARFVDPVFVFLCEKAWFEVSPTGVRRNRIGYLYRTAEESLFQV